MPNKAPRAMVVPLILNSDFLATVEGGSGLLGCVEIREASIDRLQIARTGASARIWITS